VQQNVEVNFEMEEAVWRIMKRAEATQQQALLTTVQ
jgi:hypothetical protein